MSHAKNKVNWCLKKSEKELKDSGKHRGLVIVKSSKERINKHIEKAEDNIKHADYFKKNKDFSSVCASLLFYSTYHSLLAISMKFGYESENQECTFALIRSLVEDGKINFDETTLAKVAPMNDQKDSEKTMRDIREEYQYGTALTMSEVLYDEMFLLTQKVLSEAKEVVEA